MAYTYNFVKTWQSLVNVLGTHTATKTATAQDTIYFIKQFLCGELGFKGRDGTAIAVPAGMWTVDCSSDSVSASAWGSGVDHITSYDKLVFGAAVAPKSWFVLKSIASFGGNGSALYVRVSVYTQTNPYFAVSIGTTPGANGDTIDPPTMTHFKTAQGQEVPQAAGTARLNGWLATDGTFVIANGVQGLGYINSGLLLFPVATNDKLPGDLYPWMGATYSSNYCAFTAGRMFTRGQQIALGSGGGSSTYTHLEIPNVLTVMGATGDMTDNTLPRIPAYLISDDGEFGCSLRGRVDDIKFGPDKATGLTLPNAGPDEIVLLGCLWSPPVPNEVPVF